MSPRSSNDVPVEVALRAVLDGLSPAACETLDARDAFPERTIAAFDAIGLQRHYIPVADGGELVDYDRTGRLMREVASFDVTLAVAHGKTYLGAVCVWIAGSPAQRARLAEIVGAGGAVSWALTERGHGSDLLAGEVVAEATDVDAVTRFRLTGEKWLINNATRGAALCVLARTSSDAGPRAYSLVLVEKAELTPDSWQTLPKELTHGIRGADISGIRFDQASVPADAIVGGVGRGLEIVLSAMQLTRTMCCYLSLGASDHALAIAGGFVLGRELYGRALLELPAARAVVADAVAAHVLAEAFTTFAARSVHALPQEHSAIAAAAKYLVPTLVENSMVSVRRLVGARSLVVGSTDHGTFSKIERDHRIVSLFDGNTIVNLTTLVSQFPVLLGRRGEAGAGEDDALRVAADPNAELPEFRPERLSLLPKRGLSVLRFLRRVATDGSAGRGLSGPVADEVRTGVTGLAAELDRLTAQVHSQPRASVETSVEAFDAAERLAACIAGAAAVAVWVHGCDTRAGDGNPLWQNALWLRLALHAVADALGMPTDRPDHLTDEAVMVFADATAFGHKITLLPGGSGHGVNTNSTDAEAS
ncbi:acyl-CoA dehydrogenase family protein [Rhodococcus sp. 852002-51564_SCH6189132-a]|uniref:acyl-CoA dehydrogenase family protein n=1 Tax=Rhodococcus sp. 852002-51564_SCH6189132-a TaxID=1834103 RepID=UPI0009EEDD41|nr:acyl-CoA dehydrogenase family protein [Rhodococcus sp. 852002-51564_SCH6189132-a]